MRELCAKAVSAGDGDLQPVLQELARLLRGTIDHMRKSATTLLVEGKPLPEPRRRTNDKGGAVSCPNESPCYTRTLTLD
jgi:hypothetical protein